MEDRMKNFISEDELDTFDGWLKSQGIDEAALGPDQVATWRELFEEARQSALASRKVGLMKLHPAPGVYRYAVALREGADLWLAIWAQRSRKGEFFVMIPRGERAWDPHTSYHLDGTLHMKSYGSKFGPPQKRQSLKGSFRGTEHLGAYGGYGPKRVGAICDPEVFAGVIEVAPGVLGPRHGTVVLDLVEPGQQPMSWPFTHLDAQKTFHDTVPNIVIRVSRS
jgi:hypothetical protein